MIKLFLGVALFSEKLYGSDVRYVGSILSSWVFLFYSVISPEDFNFLLLELMLAFQVYLNSKLALFTAVS